MLISVVYYTSTLGDSRARSNTRKFSYIYVLRRNIKNVANNFHFYILYKNEDSIDSLNKWRSMATNRK